MKFTFVRELFSGVDNQTADIGRVIWLVSVLSFIGIAVYALVMGKYGFDPMTYGGGLAALIGAGGAALGFKSKTEPGCEDSH